MWHGIIMKWAGSTIDNLTRMKACQKHVKAMCGHKKTEVGGIKMNQVSGCIRDKQNSPLEPLSSRCSRSPYAPRRRRWKAGPTGWILGGCTELRVYHEKFMDIGPEMSCPINIINIYKHHKPDITRPKVRREAIRIWHTALRIRRWRNAWAIAQLQLHHFNGENNPCPAMSLFTHLQINSSTLQRHMHKIARLHLCSGSCIRLDFWSESKHFSGQVALLEGHGTSWSEPNKRSWNVHGETHYFFQVTRLLWHHGDPKRSWRSWGLDILDILLPLFQILTAAELQNQQNCRSFTRALWVTGKTIWTYLDHISALN